ncbi:MAG: hypothetical protein WCQ95_07200 [Bacteroidota bacterium]
MAIVIKEVVTQSDRKKFVRLPFEIYKGNAFWVPSMDKDEIHNITPGQNPAYDFCSAKFWIVLKEGKCVGRIGAIVNHVYNEKKNENMGRICRMEFADDYQVSKLLFDTAENWLKQQKVDGVLGPLGFTNLDTQGLLIEGFEHLQSIASVYHLPYYQTHFEKYGYEKEIDWVEFRLFIKEVPPKAARLADLIKERHNLKVINPKSKKELMGYAQKVFELLNLAFEELPFVVSFDEKMRDYYIHKYFNSLNYNFVKIIETQQGDLAGFIICVPSLSKAFQKAKGKLLPFGFIPVLKALKHPVEADIFLTAVNPKLQSMGIPAILINEVQQSMIAHGVKAVETTGIFETNHKAITTWKNYDHIMHKRRRCYRKMF